MIHQILYHRGDTQISVRLRADNRLDLRLNGHPPSPISWEELADLVYTWSQLLKKEGYPPQPYGK